MRVRAHPDPWRTGTSASPAAGTTGPAPRSAKAIVGTASRGATSRAASSTPFGNSTSRRKGLTPHSESWDLTRSGSSRRASAGDGPPARRSRGPSGNARSASIRTPAATPTSSARSSGRSRFCAGTDRGTPERPPVTFIAAPEVRRAEVDRFSPSPMRNSSGRFGGRTSETLPIVTASPSGGSDPRPKWPPPSSRAPRPPPSCGR